jgi:hypothetical protein
MLILLGYFFPLIDTTILGTTFKKINWLQVNFSFFWFDGQEVSQG